MIAMATIHISEADAARDLPGLLAKVREGAEVVIDDGNFPPAVLRSTVPAPPNLSEGIEAGWSVPQETGESPESRRVGFMEGRGDVGPEFFDPLPDEELRLWNGEGE
jgi:antitoxin (DNA-binding transcriptional repressor) of toxin-antitoxin stability system